MKQSEPNINPSFREKSSSHYAMPEGYFFDFAERMKERIAQEEMQVVKPQPKSKTLPLYRVLRPVLYVAASLLLTIGLFQTYQIFTATDTVPLTKTQSFVSSYDESNDERDYMSFIKESSSDVLSNEWVLADYYE